MEDSEGKFTFKGVLSVFGVTAIILAFFITIGVYKNKVDTLEQSLSDQLNTIKSLESRINSIERKVEITEYIIGDIKNGSKVLKEEVRTQNGRVDVDITDIGNNKGEK